MRTPAASAHTRSLWATCRRIAHRLQPHRWFFSLAVITMFIQSILFTYAGKLYGSFIDLAIAGGGSTSIIHLSLLLALLETCVQLAGMLNEYLYVRIASEVTADLQQRLFRRVIGLDIAAFCEKHAPRCDC